MRSIIQGLIVAVTAFTALSHATAQTVPFTEEFSSDSADWRDAIGVAELDWSDSGGVDDSGFAFGSFNFLNSNADDTPALQRAQDEWNSSGNAFVGDWLDAGVTEFHMSVRHNAPEPLSYFARFAGPANFPGAIAIEFAPVLPGVWTEIAFAIDPLNPQIILEGFPFEDVFSNIGHVQIGVTVPASLAGVDASYTFDVDRVGIVPEPASLVLLLGLAAFARRAAR